MRVSTTQSLLAATIAFSLGTAFAEPLPSPHRTQAAPELRSAPGVRTVFNCGDHGTGSLRAEIAAAAAGDTIDLTRLSCSTITLTTGQIVVAQSDLSIIGPGIQSLDIAQASDTGAYPDSRLFDHTGSGIFAISGLALRYGSAQGGSGGCLASSGSVRLDHAVVTDCQALDDAGVTVLGGAIYTVGALTLQSAQVGSSTVSGTGFVCGGALYTLGNLSMTDSVIVAGHAISHGKGRRGYGGGACVRGSAQIVRSSVLFSTAGDNTSPGNVGGLSFFGAAELVNSTVAGNGAKGVIGGLYASASLTLHNSTVSFNQADTSTGAYGQEVAAGVFLYDAPLNVESTIISSNTWSGVLFDLNGVGTIVTGSHNLITGSAISPPGTLTGDPLLSFAFIGNTALLALGEGSSAIDHGSNPDGLATDQRGAARVYGPAADIGAYEVQGDAIFADGFDG